MLIPFLVAATALFVLAIWLASEFGHSRPTRILFGIAAMSILAGITYVAASIGFTFNYNAWYGSATSELIHAVVEETENGHSEKVLKVLRQLDRDYHPNYENRGEYRELAAAATAAIRSPGQIPLSSHWNSSPISKVTWEGHWENDSGYWIVVRHSSNWTVTPSGGPLAGAPALMSSDMRQLRFTDSNGWDHLLTPINKFEARHEVIDSKSGSVREVESLHKLIRALPEHKAVTEVELRSTPIAPHASAESRME